ncbi:MAG: hypothetical protein DDT42_02023 [candidate division WS2 bacterium]|uniref:Uncharacterized protein n=1 Tax=Psychracetigena formicireducens TaxID=2986056 RepID=A0A9E2F5F6_PSYF1|nr:hypothetical protein [Candidatus Psychracetigena formicireducens]
MKKGFKLVSVVLTVVLMIFFFGMPSTVAQEAKQSVSDRGKLVYEFDDGSKVTVMHASPGSVLLGFGGPDKCEENAEIKENIVLQKIGWPIN